MEMSRLWSPAGGVPDRPPPFGVWVARGGGRPPRRPAPVTAPSLASLNAAIAKGEAFLGGLYKPLGAAGAVQSEHYGLPIRVRFPGYGRWVLLGQGDDGTCPAEGCPLPTRIRTLESAYATEAYELTFATPASPEGLRLRARVDWDAGGGRYQVSVTALSMDDPATTAEIWLDDVRLGSFAPGPVDGEPPVLRRSFPVREVGHLR